MRSDARIFLTGLAVSLLALPFAGSKAVANTACDALQRDSLGALKLALEGGPAPETSSLHLAIEQQDIDAVARLLSAGADTSEKSRLGRSVLGSAITGEATDIVRLLLRKGADPDSPDCSRSTPLHAAARSSYAPLEHIGILIDAGASLEAEDRYGHTPLHSAAVAGRSAAVDELLTRGANLPARDEYGKTALHVSAEAGMVGINPSSTLGAYLETVEVLLKHGAAMELADNDGFTPLLAAIKFQRLEIIDAMIDAGANLETRVFGSTPLHWSASYGHVDATRLLVQRGTSIDAQDEIRGMTALQLATLRGHVAVVKYLLDAGADRSIRDTNGQTAFDIAVSEGNANLQEFLLRSP